jgi:glutathione S-transferase
MEAAMIAVHHLDNSRSHRVLWLLEELGCTYDIVTYRRDRRDRPRPRLASENPSARQVARTE